MIIRNLTDRELKVVIFNLKKGTDSTVTTEIIQRGEIFETRTPPDSIDIEEL